MASTLVAPAPVDADTTHDQCLVMVESKQADGMLVVSEPECFATYDEVLQAAGAPSQGPSVSPRTVDLEAANRSLAATATPGIIGTHYDGLDFTGPSITVGGGDCLGGWLPLGGDPAWNNRISSTVNGCPIIIHHDLEDPFNPPPSLPDPDLELEATTDGGGNLTDLSDRVSFIFYDGDDAPERLKASTPYFSSGNRAQVVVGPAQAGGNGPLVAEVVSGPNRGTTVRCLGVPFVSTDCTAPPAGFWYPRRPLFEPNPVPDVVRFYQDSNLNGQHDYLSEPRVYVTVRRIDDDTTYSALGDSYSSGEGLGNDFSTGNECHRSRDAYSQLLERPFGSVISDFATVEFFACSGARTYHVGRTPDPDRSDQSGPGGDNEPLQVISLEQAAASERVDLVTITIGGNDANWTSAVQECLFEGAYDCIDPANTFPGNPKGFTDYIDERLDLVRERLRLTAIELQAAAPDASIVVVGYPYLFPASAAEQDCGKLDPNFPSGKFHLTNAEQDYFRAKQEAFDDDMRDVAADVGVWYFSPLAEFAGHEVCGTLGEWVNALVLDFTCLPGAPCVPTGVKGATFHPNAAGHRGYANAIGAFLEQTLAAGANHNAGGFPVNPLPAAAAATFAPQSIGPAVTAAPAVTTPEPTIDLTEMGPISPPACADRSVYVGGTTVTFEAEGFTPSAAVSAEVAFSDREPTTTIAASADSEGVVSVDVALPAVASDSVFMVVASGDGAEVETLVASSDVYGLATGQPLCANADGATTGLDTAVQIDVIGNDSVGRAPLDPASVLVMMTPQHGTTSAQAGAITYTPDDGFHGTDRFAYQVCEQNAAALAAMCASADVVVEVDAGCTISGTTASEELFGTGGPDVICAGAGDDVVYGGAGNDIILGDDGNDVLYGDGGDDLIYGGPGDDLAIGGDGDDSLDPGDDPLDATDENLDLTPPTATIVTPADGAVVPVGTELLADYSCQDEPGGSGILACLAPVALGEPIDTTTAGPVSLTVTAVDNRGLLSATTSTIEIVEGSPPDAADDTATVRPDTTTDLDVLANDTDPDSNLDDTTLAIVTPPASGEASVENTTDGTRLRYTAPATATEDVTVVYQVCDTTGLCDTATLTIQVADCTITGTGGSDVLWGTSGDDVICAGDGHDLIFARGGNDIVVGGNGSDVIFGGAGDDELDGGNGADALFGGAGSDVLDGGVGPDLLSGGRGDDNLSGSKGNDVLIGSRGNDTLDGGGGNDALWGNAGDDLLLGAAGDDALFGGTGVDSCDGGDGSDAGHSCEHSNEIP